MTTQHGIGAGGGLPAWKTVWTGAPFLALCLASCLALAAWAPPLDAQVEVKTLAGDLDGAVGGVAVDALGYVYVADFGERVWKIDPFGEVEVFVDSLYGTSGNTIDGEGNLLQSSFNANTLSKIARDGTVTTLARNLQGPVGVTLDGEGNAVVCNCRGNTLFKVSPEGEVKPFADGPLFNCPNGISRAPDGTFYVVNFADAKMLEVTAEGEVSDFAVIPGGGNGHVVATAAGFYVTGFRSNQVYQVSLEGEVTVLAGTGAFEDKDGPAAEAAFSSPNGIAYDPVRRRLYVNDYLVPFLQRRQVPAKSTLRMLTLPSLTQAFEAAYGKGGIDAAVSAHRAFRKANPGQFTEIETNVLGYRRLQQGKVQEALRIFELNTEDYPKSFNVWDSYAEAHKAADQREEAIRYYRKSLELNPANANATKMLEEMGAAE